MHTEIKRKLLMKLCRALAVEADNRLGIPVNDEDSLTSIFDLSSVEWDISDLRKLHLELVEILNSPPPQQN